MFHRVFFCILRHRPDSPVFSAAKGTRPTRSVSAIFLRNHSLIYGITRTTRHFGISLPGGCGSIRKGFPRCSLSTPDGPGIRMPLCRNLLRRAAHVIRCSACSDHFRKWSSQRTGISPASCWAAASMFLCSFGVCVVPRRMRPSPSGRTSKTGMKK